MMKLMLVAMAVMLFAFLSFSVRVLFVKNGKFKGTCANNNPMLQKEGAVCGVCGKLPDEECQGDDEFVSEELAAMPAISK